MQHNRGHIDKIMGKYHIGHLSNEDSAEVSANTAFANPYTNDPPTSKHLLTNTRFPYNAEGRIKELRKNYHTPAGKHFMRNHNMVPDIDPKEYRLTICGAGMEETVFTLDELKDTSRCERGEHGQTSGARGGAKAGSARSGKN
jgi:hypothetical protein